VVAGGREVAGFVAAAVGGVDEVVRDGSHAFASGELERALASVDDPGADPFAFRRR
jgi:hypothetical protein